jgi:hypothetical protein
MNENWNIHFPRQLTKILRTEAAGFHGFDQPTGSLLRTLAAQARRPVELTSPQPSCPKDMPREFRISAR